MNVENNPIKYLNTLNEMLIELTKGDADLEMTINNIVTTLMKVVFEATFYKTKGLSVIDKRCVRYIIEMRNHTRPVSIDELEGTSKNSSILLKVTNSLDAIDKDLSEVLIQSLI